MFLENIKIAAGCLDRHLTLGIYDLETTGIKVEEGHKIIQFAGIICAWDDEKGGYKIIHRVTTLANPDMHIPEEASKVNGIYDEDVKDAPSQKELAVIIKKFMDQAEVICGYNHMRFDNKYVDALFSRYLGKKFEPDLQIDAMVIAKEIIPRDCVPDKSYKLANMAAYFGVSGEGFHDAEADTKFTMAVIFSEINHYNKIYRGRTYRNVRITSIREFQKSHIVDYVYFDFSYVDNDGNQKFMYRCRYDKYHKQFGSFKEGRDGYTEPILDPDAVYKALFGA